MGGKPLNGRPGALTISLFVISAAAPLTTVFGAVPAAFSSGMTSIVPEMFLLSGLLYLAFYMLLLSAARNMPASGAYHTYIARGMGWRVSFAMAAVSLVSYLFIQLGVAALFGVFFRDVLGAAGAGVSPWIWSMLALAIANPLARRPARTSTLILGIVIGVELSVLVVVNCFLLFHADISGSLRRSFSGTGLMHDRTGATLAFIVGSFVGLEAISMFKDESPQAARSERIATYLSVLFMTGVYVLSSYCIEAYYFPSDIAVQASRRQELLYFDAIGLLLGQWWSWGIRILLIVSLFACILSLSRNIDEYLSLFLFPRRVPMQAERGRACHIQTAMLVAGLMLCLFLGFDPYRMVFPVCSEIAIFGIVVTQIFVCLSFVAGVGLRGKAMISRAMMPWAAVVLAGLLIEFGFIVMNPQIVYRNSLLLSCWPLAAIGLTGILTFLAAPRRITA
ncbi:hypothetical protein ACLRDC_08240 [Gluconacetobacter sacchari]|uniref:hypothetical protein n=1 Tax=Gluconacetobacter sacchari TaxID=92759 RepID=UPI0039B3B298